MAKQVIIDQVIEMPVGTNVSAQFSGSGFTPTRNEVDSSVFGDKVDQIAKGTYAMTYRGQLRPDADMAFYTYLLGELESDNATAMLFRPKNADRGAENPEATFSVMITSVPELGGNRGDLFEGDFEFKIVTPVKYDRNAPGGVLTNLIINIGA